MKVRQQRRKTTQRMRAAKWAQYSMDRYLRLEGRMLAREIFLPNSKPVFKARVMPGLPGVTVGCEVTLRDHRGRKTQGKVIAVEADHFYISHE